MSITELGLAEGPLAAAYLLTMAALAFGVIPVTNERLNIARNCLFASCAIFAGIAIMWGITTELAFIVGPLLGVAGIAAVQSVRFILNEQSAFNTAVAPPSSSVQQEKKEPHPLVFQAKFAEMKKLEEFLGSKDENDLRLLFDMQYMLNININILNVKIGFIHAGNWVSFQYGPFLEGNKDMILWVKDAEHYTVGPSGVSVKAEPRDVFYLVTSVKYQQSKKKLVEFVTSVLLPDTVKKEVVAFDKNINENTALMIRIMDERMRGLSR